MEDDLEKEVINITELNLESGGGNDMKNQKAMV
jgi:hypothetical protein